MDEDFDSTLTTEKKSAVDAGADQSKISTPPTSFISLESKTLHPVFFKPYPHLAGTPRAMASALNDVID